MDDRLLAGVATGIAAHLDVSVAAVRLALALLVGSGVGVLAYVALWALLPVDQPEKKPRGRDLLGAPHGRARRLRQLLAYLVVGSLTSAALGALGRPFGGNVIGPLALAGVGALLIWRRAPDAQRARWTADARRTGRHLARRSTLWVPIAGSLLVLAGVAAFLAAHDALAQARAGALAILATLAGVLLVAGPWLLRLARDLGQERRARIREQERAAVAAHVHDSVLQTLALLQARAADPTAVRSLARRQERDLRAWLYGPGQAEAADESVHRTLAAELRAVCAEIEDDTAVNVDVVIVGDLDLDDRLRDLVAAAREAVLNATKHSGTSAVSLYAEVEPDRTAVWVRDRGRGFDPATVEPDRHGLRDSISGRLDKLGGTSRIRTSPGNGTEVELVLPRHGTPSTTPQPEIERPAS
jgi:signal transduction histidine kinase/phage shock protein PspC (stress-responsive transcriptional regulator)